MLSLSIRFAIARSCRKFTLRFAIVRCPQGSDEVPRRLTKTLRAKSVVGVPVALRRESGIFRCRGNRHRVGLRSVHGQTVRLLNSIRVAYGCAGAESINLTLSQFKQVGPLTHHRTHIR